MSAIWYYVENNDRVGPITAEELMGYINDGKLTEKSYVWKKGFDNWKRASEVEEFQVVPEDDLKLEIPEKIEEIDWESVSNSDRIFMVRIGTDRGGQETEYGPFSLAMLKKLFDENRINGKTYIYGKGMINWSFLADIPIFESLFAELPPMIEDDDRRSNIRRPFVAKMFFHDNSQLFEGVCRDVSTGGVQIMVSGVPVKVGEEISLNVHPDNSDYNFVARGKVVRILDGDQGFSLRFVNLNEEARNSIIDYVGN
ncbi:MAG: DUF4339 domain-containing protein [Bacteriovoracaceae bacterium]|nr:DUF4339 domain-containing protein [Bacteriovoracaceae bacterium]